MSEKIPRSGSRRGSEADSAIKPSPPRHLGAHEKRGQDKFPPRRKPECFFALGFAGRPFEGSWGVRPRRSTGLQATSGSLRGFTRPCISVNALRHTWGTRGTTHTLSVSFEASGPCFPGPGSLGSYRARGPASYGDCRCLHPSRTFGSLPASRIRPAAGPFQAQRRTLSL